MWSVHRGQPYLPSDVCELGKEQRQVEGQLQYIVIMDVHSQWLHEHTTKATALKINT